MFGWDDPDHLSDENRRLRCSVVDARGDLAQLNAKAAKLGSELRQLKTLAGVLRLLRSIDGVKVETAPPNPSDPCGRITVTIPGPFSMDRPLRGEVGWS